MNEPEPTIPTLFRWTVERWMTWPPTIRLLREMNARRVIAVDLLADRHKPIKPEQVVKRVEGLWDKLSQIIEIGKTITQQHYDTITHNPYFVSLNRENDYWVVGEKLPDGTIISQAKMFLNGKTSLTLDFTGDRFQRMHANPGIKNNENYPTASTKIFTLLAKSFLESSK